MKPFHLYIFVSIILLLGGCRATDSPVPEVVAVPVKSLGYEEQRRFDVLFLEAEVQLLAGRYDAAAELLRAALSINPDAPEALHELGVLQLSTAGFSDTLRIAESETMIRRAILLAPNNKDYKETLVQFHLKKGNYKEALRLYEDMMAAEPSVAQLSVLMQLQEINDDYAGAIASIERIERLEGKSESYSMKKFSLYTEMGDTEHAYAAIEDLCAEYPEDLSFRVMLGDLYYQQGCADIALATYQDVLTLEPDNAYAQMSLLSYYKEEKQDSLYLALVDDIVLNPKVQGDVKVEAMGSYITYSLQTGKDSTEALRLFERALRLPQDNADLAELCAYYMVAIQMSDEDLIPVLEQILAIEPENSQARFQLIATLNKREDYERIAELCREGVLHQPENPLYYYYGGIALYVLNNYPEALNTLEKGTDYLTDDTDTELASEYMSLLGDLYYKMERKNEAYEAYEAAMAYNTGNLLCLNNYAYYLSLEGERLEYAETLSRRTVEAEPDNPTYLDTYAWILYKQRNYKDAQTYIDLTLQYIEETEENAGILDHAGDIYFRAGNKAEALKFWVKSLGLTTDKEQRAVIQKKVRNRRL